MLKHIHNGRFAPVGPGIVLRRRCWSFLVAFPFSGWALSVEWWGAVVEECTATVAGKETTPKYVGRVSNFFDAKHANTYKNISLLKKQVPKGNMMFWDFLHLLVKFPSSPGAPLGDWVCSCLPLFRFTALEVMDEISENKKLDGSGAHGCLTMVQQCPCYVFHCFTSPRSKQNRFFWGGETCGLLFQMLGIVLPTDFHIFSVC